MDIIIIIVETVVSAYLLLVLSDVITIMENIKDGKCRHCGGSIKVEYCGGLDSQDPIFRCQNYPCYNTFNVSVLRKYLLNIIKK